MQCRQHLPYTSSRSSQGLFPGRQPGQPMNPVSLQVQLRDIGVLSLRGRTSAIRQLVLQAPAPVIAEALGYHDKTATRLITGDGGTWSRYAPATTHGELLLHSRWHASSLGKSEAQFAQAGQAGFKALLHRRSIGTHKDVVTQRGATGHERPGLPPLCHPLSISLEQHGYALFCQRLHDRDNVHRCPSRSGSEHTTVNLSVRGRATNTVLATQSDQRGLSKLEYATPQHAGLPVPRPGPPWVQGN